MKLFVSLIGIATAVSAQTGYGNSSYGNTSPNSTDLTFQAKIAIDVATRYQTMVGGGCSGAFGADVSNLVDTPKSRRSFLGPLQ